MATNPNHHAQQEQKTASKVWTIANLLTFLRIALMIPFLYFIKEAEFGRALLVFFIASLTDFADGYVARRFNQQSALGRFLDPLADKLLTTASFIVMAVPNGLFNPLPLWLVIAVIARDVIILTGSLVVYLMTKFKDFKPTTLGKVNTFLELGLIVVFLAFHHFEVLRFLLPLCYGIVITSVVVSGVEYVAQGMRILKTRREQEVRI